MSSFIGTGSFRIQRFANGSNGVQSPSAAFPSGVPSMDGPHRTTREKEATKKGKKRWRESESVKVANANIRLSEDMNDGAPLLRDAKAK